MGFSKLTGALAARRLRHAAVAGPIAGLCAAACFIAVGQTGHIPDMAYWGRIALVANILDLLPIPLADGSAIMNRNVRAASL